VSVNYTEPFYNYFKNRHQVDNHNNLRHSPISLEESITTKDWKLRVFTFVMALIEVNARFAVAYLTGRDAPMSQLEFRRKLAKELIAFSLTLKTGEMSKSKQVSELVSLMCGIETAPPFAGSSWTGTQWEMLTSTHNTFVKRWAAKNAYGHIVDAW
jgi:hypothetical protein